MKWLFTILVALNIVVFAGMVAGRAVRAPESKQESVTVPQSLSKPNISVESVDTSIVSAPKSAAAPAAHSAAANKPQTTPAASSAKIQNTAAADKNGLCAAAVLNADDYYRIRGLLGKWQHLATRFVEANTNTNAKKKTAAARYRVILSGGDEIRQRLQQQGFSFSMFEGKFSLGVFNRHGDAESLLVRAKLNGFDNAYIETANAGSSDEANLSVAKMRLLFSRLSTQDRQDVNAVIKNYSQLQSVECQKNN
ncbi:hypothetical protein [Stenoxybacter acetivorans]|uniref:hypothetical protein n=1 Tax=Stenoxybacter acetivorans TaxID=422441 RepID=UPI00055CAF94|nr:hypothetical protein [Stenoxybacter acetivorans]